MTSDDWGNTPKPGANYEVGYGRPPDSGKIKPGEVRNPHGRRGKARSEPNAFQKAIAKKTRVTIDGQPMIMSSDEAFFLKLMAQALAGDAAATRIISKMWLALRRDDPLPPTRAELAAEAAELEKRKALAAKLVGLLEEEARRKKSTGKRWMPDGAGGFIEDAVDGNSRTDRSAGPPGSLCSD